MKISVVTISFNQASFLEACLQSVVSQKDADVEFIVVDPGSTDGSQDILNRWSSEIDHLIVQPDDGPADGLNKGFSAATGDVFYYLNSDDVVFAGAFDQAREFFQHNPRIGVVAGAGKFIDEHGAPIRDVWSDPVSRLRIAFGGGNLIQPATFIRASDFQRVGGFNVNNRSNWDGELVTDMYLAGSRFKIVDNVWGGYRLHRESITSTGRLFKQIGAWSMRRQQKLGYSLPRCAERFISSYFRLERIMRHPRIIYQRFRSGPVFGRNKE
jgi:glycosyltransferase involved in cell wall biosynthesis